MRQTTNNVHGLRMHVCTHMHTPTVYMFYLEYLLMWARITLICYVAQEDLERLILVFLLPES